MVILRGSGRMNDYSSNGDGAMWARFKRTTRIVFVCQGLTTIGSGAFNSFSNLASIALPEGIMFIGERAFFGCIGLKTITFPNSLIEIGAFAFEGYTNLETITFQNYLYFMRERAFRSCRKLTSINLEFVLLIDGSAFRETPISIQPLPPVDAEFLFEIGEKNLEGSNLPLSVGRAIEMLSGAQRAGKQDPNYDDSLLPFRISRALLEHP